MTGTELATPRSFLAKASKITFVTVLVQGDTTISFGSATNMESIHLCAYLFALVFHVLALISILERTVRQHERDQYHGCASRPRPRRVMNGGKIAGPTMCIARHGTRHLPCSRWSDLEPCIGFRCTTLSPFRILRNFSSWCARQARFISSCKWPKSPVLTKSDCVSGNMRMPSPAARGRPNFVSCARWRRLSARSPRARRARCIVSISSLQVLLL